MARYRLGDICTIVSGSTPKTEVAEYWDGDIKWITPAELNDDSYIIEDSARKLTALGVQKTGLTPFPAGTVILSSRAPIGKVAIAGCEMYCNQGFKNLICSELVYNKYLFWYLKGKTEYLNSLGRGATFKEISKQIVSGIEIELPPMEEQVAIARRFEQLNLLLHERKQEIIILDQLIKARFVEMFGDPVNNPKNWEMATLGELTTVGSSKRIFEKEYVETGIPFYRTKEIVELSKGNPISTELFITESRYNEIKEQFGVPQEGDLLVSAVGTIGIIWIVDGRSEFYFKDGNLLRVDRSAKFNSVYMKYLLSCLLEEFKKQMSAGTAYAALTISGLSKMQVYDVPIGLQNQFATFVSQVDKSKVVVQKALDEAQLLFDSLMQKYFG